MESPSLLNVSLLNVDYKIATKPIGLRIAKGTSTFDQSHSNRLRKRKVHRRKHQTDFRYNGNTLSIRIFQAWLSS